MSSVPLLDFEPSTETLLDDVLQGLGASPRHLPCKYFYDEHGSMLFDRICELDEYYPTRSELSIMERFAAEMADQIGPGVMLVEYGSGSSIKTRLLLDHLSDATAYVPVDISREHLQRTSDQLSLAYPDIEVLPVCADFTEDFDLPRSRRVPSHVAVYFPGSTIGNFAPAAARAILSRIAPLCGAAGGLLIGVDLQKEIRILEAAYNDADGVTAQFNLNLLRRINRELDSDFKLDQFEHNAFYDPEHCRIEIQLVSQCEQTVNIEEKSFDFGSGDVIRTEYSHKYTIPGFARIAAQSGLTLHKSWSDEQQMFAVVHLVVD